MLIDSALRSIAFAMAMSVVIFVCRSRHPRLLLLMWRLVLLGCLVIPTALIILPFLMPASPFPGPVPLQSDVVAVISNVEWPTLLIGLYGLVAASLLLYEVVGLCNGWRIIRSAQAIGNGSSDVPIVASREISAPLTFGSCILLPFSADQWSDAKRAAVFAHERSHVANHDFYVRIAARLYRALFWFNPLAWWLPRQLSFLEERVADEVACEVAGSRVSYAAMLLEIAERSNRLSVHVAMADDTLSLRIERLLDSSQQRSPPARRARLLVPLLALPMISYAAVSGIDMAPYRCRNQSDNSLLMANFGNCAAPASNPSLPLSQPFYPAAARRSGQMGTVVLRLLVGPDGSVRDIRIDKSSGYHLLDAAARAGAERWRLRPGAVRERPIDAWGQFAVTFKLDP